MPSDVLFGVCLCVRERRGGGGGRGGRGEGREGGKVGETDGSGEGVVVVADARTTLRTHGM